MRSAEESAECWCASVLLTKIVDGRSDLESIGDPPAPTFEQFFITVEDGINARIKKWRRARVAKLLELEIPDVIFTPSAFSGESL